MVFIFQHSVADLIVIEPAAAVGVNISLRDPARAGMTAALASLAILAAGIGARSAASSFDSGRISWHVRIGNPNTVFH